jgi:hypothetical protein
LTRILTRCCISCLLAAAAAAAAATASVVVGIGVVARVHDATMLLKHFAIDVDFVSESCRCLLLLPHLPLPLSFALQLLHPQPPPRGIIPAKTVVPICRRAFGQAGDATEAFAAACFRFRMPLAVSCGVSLLQ